MGTLTIKKNKNTYNSLEQQEHYSLYGEIIILFRPFKTKTRQKLNHYFSKHNQRSKHIEMSGELNVREKQTAVLNPLGTGSKKIYLSEKTTLGQKDSLRK